MSTVILLEQRPPIIIQIFSRVPTYAHFVTSVVAILVFWLRPSLAPKMPREVVRQIPKSCIVRALSLKSTSTLVDHTSGKSDDLKNAGEKSPSRLYKPFSKLATPVKMMVSPTIARVRPYARRMSLPARRFTEHVASAIATPFHHHRRSLDLEADSYFAPHSLPKVEAGVQVQVEVVEVEGVTDSSLVQMGAVETINASPKKPTKFKRVVKKAKALLRIRRRS